jgi:hypothetical protein
VTLTVRRHRQAGSSAARSPRRAAAQRLERHAQHALLPALDGHRLAERPESVLDDLDSSLTGGHGDFRQAAVRLAHRHPFAVDVHLGLLRQILQNDHAVAGLDPEHAHRPRESKSQQGDADRRRRPFELPPAA